MSRNIFGTPVYDGAIEEVSCWGDGESVGGISCMIQITVCVKEVGILLCFVDLWITCFEETLNWDPI